MISKAPVTTDNTLSPLPIDSHEFNSNTIHLYCGKIRVIELKYQFMVKGIIGGTTHQLFLRIRIRTNSNNMLNAF